MGNDIKNRLAEATRELAPGSLWKYFDGGNYRIRSLELCATSYEETHQASIVVVYEQLYQGSFPEGQVWVRSLDDFRSDVQKDGKKIPKFLKVSEQ